MPSTACLSTATQAKTHLAIGLGVKAAQAGHSVSSDTAGPANGNGNGGATVTAAPASQPPVAKMTDTPPVVPAKMVGLDLGPACSQCGGMMQRTGSCYTCSSCGNNTGCG